MTERPILFSASMVNALREGRKTQTRRIVKGDFGAIEPSVYGRHEWTPWRDGEAHPALICPYGVPGDHLYVRETFRLDVSYDKLKPSKAPTRAAVWYEAGGQVGGGVAGKTRVSIHMPRWASRILLEVNDVAVERLHEISEGDAQREGAAWHDGRGIGHSGWRHDKKDVHDTARDSFFRLWMDINGEESLRENPFVWVVSFRRIET